MGWQIKLGKEDNGTKPNRAKLLPSGGVRSGKESLAAARRRTNENEPGPIF